MLVVEDHAEDGGVFDAVSGALVNTQIKVHGLSVRGVCCAGNPSELLNRYGMDAEGISRKVSDIINESWGMQSHTVHQVDTFSDDEDL